MTTTNLFDNSNGFGPSSSSPFQELTSASPSAIQPTMRYDELIGESEEEDQPFEVIAVKNEAAGARKTADMAITVDLDTTVPISAESVAPQTEVGKPQVIVRIRPSPHIDLASTFEVDPATKMIQIRVEKDPRVGSVSSRHHSASYLYFPADDVLENSSQEVTFKTVAGDIVEKAMSGAPGMIVAIGPEVSGKSFTLFGLSGRYRNRGVAARALEKMFEIKERKQGEIDYKFGIGIVEVRRDRIRDLLTLSPNEINEVSDRGPKGMYVEEVDSMEQGLGLLLRALVGQKLIHKEAYERYHTIVYFEILAGSPVNPEMLLFQSRITLCEISAPNSTSSQSSPRQSVSTFQAPCSTPPPIKQENKFKVKKQAFPSTKCCNPGSSTGPLAESIAVRRDVFALEQIFLKANEMFRLQRYFSKVENLGLSMVAAERRKLSSGHNFRHNRLAHCLKDILRADMEIRIILHVRPDKTSLRSSLEAMRFAERCRLVPSNLGGPRRNTKLNRTDDQILQEMITEIAPELMHPAANMGSMNSEKMKVIHDQAIQYFENNIDSMKVCTREKVKTMFENFRVLWNFLWELEMSLTLKKVEEQMKQELEKFNDQGENRGEPRVADNGPNTKRSIDSTVQGEYDEVGVSKKSLRKSRKDKSQKKKKEKTNSRRSTMKTTQKESEVSKAAAGLDVTELETEEGTTPKQNRASNTDEMTSPIDIDAYIGSNEQEGGEEGEDEMIIGGQGESKRPTIVGDKDIPDPEEEELVQNDEEIVTRAQGDSAGSQPQSSPHGEHEHVNSGSNNPQTDLAARHNSAFFARDGHNSYRLNNGLVQGGNTKTALTEEELAELAAQQEQQISNNFEEMKKVARRQAIHLLRTGISRPQWMSLF